MDEKNENSNNSMSHVYHLQLKQIIKIYLQKLEHDFYTVTY